MRYMRLRCAERRRATGHLTFRAAGFQPPGGRAPVGVLSVCSERAARLGHEALSALSGASTNAQIDSYRSCRQQRGRASTHASTVSSASQHRVQARWLQPQRDGELLVARRADFAVLPHPRLLVGLELEAQPVGLHLHTRRAACILI